LNFLCLLLSFIWNVFTIAGGYFTCLETDGTVFDTDKFSWLQARQVWMLSKLYNFIKNRDGVEKKEWLDAAKLGADFLLKHGHDDRGYFYFSLTKDGRPITQPHSIFSDCFASMAFAQYAKASGEQWAKEWAIKTFENIEKRKENPKGIYNKAFPGTRSFYSLAVPMIDVNLCMELAEVLPDLDIESRIKKNISFIFDKFLDKETGLLRENVPVNPDDTESLDTFEGRLINPGHSIECLWFIMDVANKRNMPHLIDQCCEILLKTLEFGWDKEFGGFFYFMDIKNKPPQQLEWDQKLWWVHIESLIALSLAYLLTRRPEFAQWYHKVHTYSWIHFHDRKGEWFGYLNRRGEVLLNLKGGKWKGCFHVPRGMLYCSEIFRQMAEKD
jgi:N-acylglucosamine 2-epimerase